MPNKTNLLDETFESLTLESFVYLLEDVVLDLLDGVPDVHVIANGGVESVQALLAEIVWEIRLNL